MAILRRSYGYFRDLLRPLSAETIEPDKVLRARVLVIYTCLTLVMAISWMQAHLSYGSPGTALIFLCAVVFSSAALFRLSLDRRLTRASQLILLIAILLISLATGFTGGLRLTNVAPFFMTIVAAFFLLGRAGLPWAIASILIPLGFEIAAHSGVVFPDTVPAADRPVDAFVTWLSSAVVVGLFAFFYEEARVLAVRRLRAANQAKAQFLANISHELRTPLHAMVAGSDLLDQSDLSTEQRALLRQGRQQGERLGELIDDLLDLSALETGRFTIRPVDICPGEVLREVAAVIAPTCKEKGLAFAHALDESLPALVRGDAGRLRQILLNLASNAVKFTDQGGVELRATAAGSPAFPHACIFTVRDTGVGIAAPDRRRIFSSFTQLDASLGRAHEGAGLGLYISHQLASRMGGSIGVQSEPGAGSTFRLELPFGPPLGDHAHAGSGAAPLRVLLVDDNTINQELARRMLEKLGHQVLLATSGEMGVSLCASEQPDVVLMDIQMPGMDGLAAMRAIRGQERERDANAVPLVAMSGHHAAHHAEAYQDLGVASALVRPFTREDLERALAASRALTG